MQMGQRYSLNYTLFKLLHKLPDNKFDFKEMTELILLLAFRPSIYFPIKFS